MHPLARLQLSTSELPGKHKLSTTDKFSDGLVVVVVLWNRVDAPETSRAGRDASCSNDGGEFDVDSDSQGLVLTSPDNLERIQKVSFLFINIIMSVSFLTDIAKTKIKRKRTKLLRSNKGIS